MHKSSRYFCSVSKVYPEYKIIILFRRFCFSIVLYEFSPYPICELKCLLQLQNCTSLWQAQSTLRFSLHDGLIPMPLLILPAVSCTDHCLYPVVLFALSHSERPFFRWNWLFIKKKVSQLQIAKVPFLITWLVLRPWQIFIFLCDFNNRIFLLIGQLLTFTKLSVWHSNLQRKTFST